jgi:hypothetical protein
VNGSTVCRDAGVGIGPVDALVVAVACGDGGVRLHPAMPMAAPASSTSAAISAVRPRRHGGGAVQSLSMRVFMMFCPDLVGSFLGR